MPKLYGIPYMGSKTKIAVDILRRLPNGKRFVDLCGGGFAMSHAAVLSRKFDSVYYNDFNPLVVELTRNALAGKYNYKVFKPPFVTREDFYRLKDTDGYVKYIWSFGNTGKEYMFGKDVEPLKHKAHDFVVFGKWDDELDKILPNVRSKVRASGVHNRRLEFCGYARQMKHRFDLQQLEQLERLQQLEQLERLQRLERDNEQQIQQLTQIERLQQIEQLSRTERLQQIETHCGSLFDYKYQDGDVVYIDPPYESEADYDGGFNFKQFYDWVYEQPYQIWFSGYKVSDKRFKMIWARELRSSYGAKNAAVNFECIYTNKGGD